MNTTQQAQHTPGPWHNLQGFNKEGLFVCEEIEPNICEMTSSRSIEETQANARLIAAAPELLEALKGMLEWSRRVTVSNPGMEPAKALQAIAKAEGRVERRFNKGESYDYTIRNLV